MKIKMNRAMKTVLDQFGVTHVAGVKPENVQVFEEVLNEGISNENGCLLLKKNLSFCKSMSTKDFPDLTGYECYINKINVDDYVKASDPKYLLQYTFCLAQLLDSKLSRFKEKVQILIGFQVDDIATSSIRFHKVRSNEAWLDDDLEKYGESILVWEVN